MAQDRSAAADNFGTLVSRFQSGRTEPFEVQAAGVETRDGVSIQDVLYTGTAGERVPAYWVVPKGAGPFPGVIFVHPAPGDRTTFLEEAVQLAGQGTASLVVEAPWAQGEQFGPKLADPEAAQAAFTQVINDLRRAVDFLVMQPEIDATRLAYVGHSFGALVGGVLAGVEKRLRALVLMAGTGSFMDVVTLNMPFLEAPVLEHYAQVIAPVDPIHYLPRAAPAALFFQFGTQDEFPREQFEQVAGAASEPKQVRWYETDHFMQIPEAQQDRQDWLQTQLHK